jgi:Uma2 family endonuclease
MATADALDSEQLMAPAIRLDPDKLYEEIDGRLVEMPPMSVSAAVCASELHLELGAFIRPRDLGRSVVEALFHLPDPINRNRRPDVAFVSYDRFPKSARVTPENAWDVVPDLAVEVVSPNDGAAEQMEKVIEYFRAGVRLVWVVYPEQEFVVVHDSLTQMRGLTRADTLDGGAVLPGFALPLTTLFPPPASP